MTADKCSFCAEWHSTAVVQDDMNLAHTDCKEMSLCTSQLPAMHEDDVIMPPAIIISPRASARYNYYIILADSS